MISCVLLMLSFASLAASQAARRCYECQDMPHPSDCHTTTLCPAGHECVLENFVTSGGQVLFNSGCRSQQMCSGHKRRGLPSNVTSIPQLALAKRSDLPVCDECCDKDFCNDQGCGHTALRQPQRPALCFQCDAAVNPGLCRHIKRCDVDEVCMLTEMRARADNGDTLYKSGCVSPQVHVCRGYAAALVGKRKRMTYCHVCCHDDYCNDICHVGVTPLPNTPTHTRPTIVAATSTTTRVNGGGEAGCHGVSARRRVEEGQVDGGWGSWLPWSQCSQTCGEGSRSRARSCDNPAPAGGGNGCHGDSKENDTCNNQVCSDWSAWFYGPCSVTCGTGTQQAMRTCSSGHVEDCTGPSSKTETCTQAHCADWGAWFYAPCSVTCGTGTQQAMRTCISGHVEDCTGPSSKTETCTQAPCAGVCPDFPLGCPTTNGCATLDTNSCPICVCQSQPTNPPTNPPTTTVAPYTCFYKNELYTQGQSWNDGCSQSCTCTDASIGTYSCRGRCLVWNELPSVCTLEDAPGRCCQQPKCPTGILITIPKGFEKEYPGYTTDT